ncbi:AmmeMemoRadiSam system protein B [Planctomycetota bacterium]|nr:AmmeMemoRadiSam system protein B [Planctomycetota bacterium]
MTKEATRQPAMAGKFYTAVPARLHDELTAYLASPSASRAKAYGVMVPHAGYMYSGAICGRALASIEVPQTVLILHTKHQLGGGPFCLAAFKEWVTPLGTVMRDETLAAALAEIDDVDESNLPHFQEHAAEVVIPFLQELRPDVKACVMAVSHSDYPSVERVAEAISKAVLQQEGDVLLIASTDMNHYEDHDTTIRKDQKVLDPLSAYDIKTMYEVCYTDDISMCGLHATAVTALACKHLGASTVEILEHKTSGDVNGETNQVVGYASARFF